MCFLSTANGARVRGGAHLDASDLHLRLSVSTNIIEAGGRGITVVDGSVALRRSIIERMIVSAVDLGADGSLTATDVLLGDLLPCGPECEGLATGSGIVMAPSSRLMARRFTIFGSTGTGLDPGSAELDLADGVFAGNSVAVRLPQGLDRASLLRGVRYQGNVVDWEFVH